MFTADLRSELRLTSDLYDHQTLQQSIRRRLELFVQQKQGGSGDDDDDDRTALIKG